MGRRDEDAASGFPVWGAEAVLWLGCLSVAVMPTGLVLMAWRAWVGAVTPVAGLVTYVVLFTLFVVTMKPWTVR
ncbi:hypothetical protein [Caulobacter sp. RL271]|uniref:Uncharacterized protein n=1 Tax=Caulobacter segnis TaxID=88688 RepID=A0ABY4ZRD3_9CAUL|nr:hypothetical protein [Caulobacter segnis]USQ95266.1 hypothetical protein MZV50_22390 [Caulobacter segnis]